MVFNKEAAYNNFKDLIRYFHNSDEFLGVLDTSIKIAEGPIIKQRKNNKGTYSIYSVHVLNINGVAKYNVFGSKLLNDIVEKNGLRKVYKLDNFLANNMYSLKTKDLNNITFEIEDIKMSKNGKHYLKCSYMVPYINVRDDVLLFADNADEIKKYKVGDEVHF